MRKFILGIAAFLMSGLMAFAQPVSDNAVIPVAVTLNSVLRLNVINGGNIEFVFNTLAQYKAGINNGGALTAYHSKITVESSQDWKIMYGAEDGTFISDNGLTLPLNNVGLSVEATGVHTIGGELVSTQADGTNVADLPLFSASEVLVGNGATHNGGDAADNAFTIKWRAGTIENDMNAASLLDQDVAPGRYVTNVILQLQLD